MQTSKIVRDENGVTIGALRQFLSGFTEDGEVWLCRPNGLTNICVEIGVEITRLNANAVVFTPRVMKEWQLLNTGDDEPALRMKRVAEKSLRMLASIPDNCSLDDLAYAIDDLKEDLEYIIELGRHSET